MRSAKLLFQYVEIETCNMCTRSCLWCNYGGSKEYLNRQISFLETRYIEEVLKDLKKMDFRGVLSLFSINEPLLDKRICNGELIELSKKIMNPEVKVNIVTNGDLLNQQIIENMIDAGLDILCVSCYEQKIYKKAQFLFNIYKEKIDFSIFDYRASKQNKLKYNRAGSIAGKDTKILPYCLLPSFSSVVGWDGEVRLCAHDSLGRIKFGNIKTERYCEIIQSTKMQSIRKKLIFNRSLIYPCNICNYEGILPY